MVLFHKKHNAILCGLCVFSFLQVGMGMGTQRDGQTGDEKEKSSPDLCGSVGWGSSHKAKSDQFDSGSGHISRL